jgi:hypothetical protein
MTPQRSLFPAQVSTRNSRLKEITKKRSARRKLSQSQIKFVENKILSCDALRQENYRMNINTFKKPVLYCLLSAFSPSVYASGSNSSHKFAPVSDCASVFLRLDPHRETLVVVDGVSSGKEAAKLARQNIPGIQLIHFATSPNLPPVLTGYQPSDYDANFIFDPKNPYKIIEILSRFDQQKLRVLAGSETSPYLRSFLTSKLGLPGSSFRMAPARTKKLLMIAAVQREISRRNLIGFRFRTLPTVGFENFESAHSFLSDPKTKFPLMIKPNESAGSFSARSVRDISEAQLAFKETIGVEDPLGKAVEKLIIQPLVDMNEYDEWVINYAVDPDLGVIITDVLSYRKMGTQYILTKLENVDRQHRLWSPFQQVAAIVARGLGKASALGHLEVFVKKTWSEKNGEIDIIFGEDGERPAGGMLPEMVRFTGRLDMTTAFILASFDRPGLVEALKAPVDQDTVAMQVEIFKPESYTRGKIQRLPTLEDFQAHLPWVKSLHFDGEIGKDLSELTNGSLVTGFGNMTLVCKENETDFVLSRIREFERNILFPAMTKPD